jgi:RHS repeat-associated protein
VLYYNHDQLGSTRVLTDSTGATVATYTYDDYGRLSASTGSPANPFGYSGQYTDAESGLQYLRARYYEPATGQFLSRDPAMASTRDVYGYAARSPFGYVDPTGTNWGPIPTSWDDVKDDASIIINQAPEAATAFMNVANGSTQAGLIYGEVTSGGNCHLRDGLHFECVGASSPVSHTPFTLGNVVENPGATPLDSARWNHETNHSTQYGVLGPLFPYLYTFDLLVEGRCNSFEHQAGYTQGGYNDPPDPCECEETGGGW